MSPSGTAPGRPATSGTNAGTRTAPGPGFWRRCRSKMTPSATSSGPSASILRSPALTSTLPGRGKRGPVPGTIGHADPQPGQAAQALGRSRGGRTTKIHLVVEGRGLPMTVLITAGNVNDPVVLAQVMAPVRE